MNLKHEVRELVEGFLAEEMRDVITVAEVRSLLQRLCDAERYGSQTALAAAMGISVQYLNQIILGHRFAGPRVLHALGLVEIVSVAYRVRVTS